MPTSLWDMFQPQDAAGQATDFGGALQSRSNSLIGLGMGMLQPSNPLRGQSTWGNALEGFQGGAQLDARTATAAAERRQRAAEAAMARSQHAADRAQAQANFERTFARSDPANAPTEFTRAARDLGLTPGTPEHAQFGKQWYSTKSEGNLAAQAEQRQTIAKNLGMDPNDPKVKYWIAGGGALNEEGKPLPAETSARVAMGGKFLDEAPVIRSQIASGMATDSITGKVKTYLNMGDEGALAAKVKSGAEALLRALTGAGMSIPEAQKYVARYEIQPTDSSTRMLQKFDQLHDELKRSEEEAFRGRGGIPRDVLERRRAAHAAAAAGQPPTAVTTEATSSGVPPTAGRGGSAPQRPANVPQGSYYSPSRNQWKLPDGTIVDAAGRPI